MQEEWRSLKGENICTKALQPSNSREKEAATEQAEPPEPRSALPEPRPAGAQGRRSGGPLPALPLRAAAALLPLRDQAFVPNSIKTQSQADRDLSEGIHQKKTGN